MAPSLTPFVANALCLHLSVVTAAIAVSLTLVMVRAAEVRPWRVLLLGLAAVLLVSHLATLAFLLAHPAIAALAEKDRALLENHGFLQTFYCVACAVVAAAGYFFWGADQPRVLPVSHALARERSLRNFARAVPWLWILCATAVVYGTGLALFRAVPAQPVVELRPLLDALDRAPAATFLLAIPALVFEELVFRLFLQGWLRRTLRPHDPGGWSAIVVPSVVWALGHAGQVAPDFPQLTQYFLAGLVQGVTMERRGLEAALAIRFLIQVLAILSLYPA